MREVSSSNLDRSITVKEDPWAVGSGIHTLRAEIALYLLGFP